jgi:hypothetical protein
LKLRFDPGKANQFVQLVLMSALNNFPVRQNTFEKPIANKRLQAALNRDPSQMHRVRVPMRPK